MSIQEIEKRILQEAEAEAAKVRKEGKAEIQKLAKFHTEKAQEVKAGLAEEARLKAEEIKRSYLVPARLKARKSVLEEKQKILKGIYDDIQKEKKLSVAELAKLREDSEVKAAQILFGE